MQLRWVFQTKNTYDLTVSLGVTEVDALDNILAVRDNLRSLSLVDIKRINKGIFDMQNVKSFSELIKLSPTFSYPIRPVNVTMSYKDLVLYGRMLETDPWTLIYEKKQFVENALATLLKIELPEVEKIKTDILAQINELSNLEP